MKNKISYPFFRILLLLWTASLGMTGCDNSSSDNSAMILPPVSNKLTVAATPESSSSVAYLQKIELKYSYEVMGADDPANYSISGTGKGTLSVGSVDKISDTEYRLNLKGIPENGLAQINISNVKDTKERELSNNCLNFWVFPEYPEVTPAPARKATINSLAQVELAFSENVSGADTLSNYTLHGSGIGSLKINAVNRLGGNNYRLTLSGTPVTGDLNISIHNITDDDDCELLNSTLQYSIDLTAPKVDTVFPENNATAVNLLQPVTVEFDEDIDPSSVNKDTLVIGDKSITGTYNVTGSKVTFTPSTPFKRNTEYKVTTTSGIKDAVGNNIGVKFSSTFKTTWTVINGTSHIDEATSIKIDSTGNIYQTGYSYSKLNGETNSGGRDAFISKFNSDGERQWTTLEGTSEDDTGVDIVIDSAGNSYVFSATFKDPGSHWTRTAFLIKVDQSGNIVFNNKIGETHDDNGALAIDSNDYVYVTSEASLDYNSNSYEILKLDKDGTTILGVNIPDIGYSGHVFNSGVDLVIDSSDNFRITGDNKDLGYTGYYYGYYTTFDSDGNNVNGYEYLKSYTSADTYARKIAVNKDDVTLFAYVTYGNIKNFTNKGGKDIVLGSHYGTSWKDQIGTGSDDEVGGLASDKYGNVYLCANSRGSINGEPTIGSGDITVIKYSPAGTLIWTKVMGTTGNDYARDMVIDNNDKIYITGSSTGNIMGHTNSGSNDIFILKTDLNGNIE